MSPIEYIKENNLAWQASFTGSLGGELTGYRGALIVEAGKSLAADRVLPPKVQVKQVVTVMNATNIVFIACEMESLAHFDGFFEKYGALLSVDGTYLLFVVDLDKDVSFEHEGKLFQAFVLDESSVWNELVDKGNLDKGELKRLSNEEKIIEVYNGSKGQKFGLNLVSYEEFKTLKGHATKTYLGAV